MDYSAIAIEDLAARVATHLQAQGIEVVLVGGLAVEIYTHNLYLTKDIDMVNTNYAKPRALHQAMAQLGFYKQGWADYSVTRVQPAPPTGRITSL